jgi:hypothetical protein
VWGAGVADRTLQVIIPDRQSSFRKSSGLGGVLVSCFGSVVFTNW